MLNNAVAPHFGQLSEIAHRAAVEWAILGNLEESDLDDTRILYAAAYTLIRIGNTVAQHSRQLEQAYPEYRWVLWVNLRNQLAHELGAVNAAGIWRALSQWLPELLAAINGEPPEAPARRGLPT